MVFSNLLTFFKIKGNPAATPHYSQVWLHVTVFLTVHAHVSTCTGDGVLDTWPGGGGLGEGEGGDGGEITYGENL